MTVVTDKLEWGRRLLFEIPEEAEGVRAETEASPMGSECRQEAAVEGELG
jgi:hypothetical protein